MREELVNNAIDDLLGTTQEMESWEKDNDVVLTDKEIEAILDSIQMCSTCGYWYDISEFFNDSIEGECDSCYDSEDEDEDYGMEDDDDD